MTTRVSVATGGAEANGASGSVGLSGDGARVVFTSLATNVTRGDVNATSDVFVHDRSTGSNHRVSLTPSSATANGPSFGGSMSPEGRYVVFTSAATDLVPGDTNGRHATAAARSEIAARNVLNGKAGLLFYGVSGRSNTPFHGGWLCVQAPRRTPVQDSGGIPPPLRLLGPLLVRSRCVDPIRRRSHAHGGPRRSRVVLLPRSSKPIKGSRSLRP